MLTIWGRTDSINVQKVMWAVGELDLEHERVDAGRDRGVVNTDAYGRLNPNRRIPTIDDGGFVLWESNVIVRYLAARYGAGGLWPTDSRQRAIADQWMDWQQTTLAAELRVVFWGLVRTVPEQRDSAAIAASTRTLGRLWAMVDAQLADRPFVAGEMLTIGDIPIGAACYRYHALDIERPALANLTRWYHRLTEREAFRTHVMLPLT